MKIFATVLMISLTIQQNPFTENNLDFYKDQTNPLVVTENSQQINYNFFAAQKNVNKKIWYFQGSNYSLTNKLNAQFVTFENDIIRNFQIKLQDSTHSITTILLQVDSVGQANISLVDCGKNNITINQDTQTIQCPNMQQELVNIQISSTISTIQDNQNITIDTNPTQKTLQYLTTIKLNIEYIISETNRQQNYAKINWIEYTLTNLDAQDMYIAFQDFSYSVVSCPPGCLNCASNRECLKCDSVFLLTSGRCDCQGKLMKRFLYQQDVNLYLKSPVCVQQLTNNTDFQEIITCETELLKRLDDNLINALGQATFNQNQIQITFQYAARTSFQYLNSFCTTNLKVFNSLKIQDTNSYLEIYYKLGTDNDFGLDKSYTLIFPNFDWCTKSDYTDQNLRVFTCPISTDYALIKDPYNDLIQEIENSYILLQDTTTNNFLKKALLPLHRTNTIIQLTADPLLNVMVCQDSSCYQELSSQDYAKTDLLYIQAIVEDPMFLYKQPTIDSQLYVNSELRNSLIQNIKAVDNSTQNLVPEYIYTILLDSRELSGKTDFKLQMNYLINQQVKSLQANFTLNIIDPYQSEAKTGFLNSITFVVVLFTFGGFIVLAIIGIFANLIAKSIGRKPKSQKDYEKSKNSEGQHRKFEMVSSHIHETEKANKILSSLMN